MNLRLLLLIPLLSLFQTADAQVFWSEDFDGTVCAAGSGCDPSLVSWTVVSTAAEGGDANRWYVSDTESGMAPPQCGTAGQNDQSMHVGNVSTSSAAAIFCPTGDCGAAYDDSGPGEITSKRAESPVINCTGQANITVDFNYIENGAANFDDCSFWYFDGATWSNIDPIAKTPTGCAPQGQWTAIPSINLPASADNNPNVRIGFLWVNDGAGSASDPSFAVDDITLTNNATGSISASFSANDSTLCEGDCINFTDLSSGTPNAWTWYFPGSATATSSVQNPTNICYATAGTYDVSLVVSDGTNTDSLYMPNFITVNPPPTITANASPGTTVCVGDMVTLTGGGGVSYSWTGGVTDGVPFAAAATQTYTVTGTDANGCTNTAQITITVNSCSSVTAIINSTNTNICVGDSVVFTDASVGANQWNWDFDLTAIGGAAPGTAATQGPHTVFYNVPGVYTVQLIASDGTNSDTTTTTVTVTTCTQPTAGISMNDGDGEICVNNCIDFTYNGGSGGTPSTINWTFEGGTPSTYNSTDPNEVITVCWNDTTGTFNVGITATNANGSSTANQTVVVHEEPVVDAGLDTTIIIGQDANLNAIAMDTAGNPLSGGSYSWTPPFDLSCPNCPSTGVLQPLNTGVYTVTYTDQYGCVVTDQVTIIVDIALNIGVPSGFSPNGDGTNDFLYVKGGLVIESMNFSIYNRYGQKVFETTNIEEGWDGTHNGKELNPGVFVYYLNVVFIDGSTQELKGNTTLVK